jgi:hypothetical protein
MLGDKLNTIKKNKTALIGDSEKTGLEANAEKSKYMSMFDH